jgi:LacI family transcriptional regulator
MRRVTINDVAEHANVSKATVSHVINNTRFVTEETRNRVMQVISKLGYQPSMAARSLTTHRTGTIGIIVSDIANNFFADMLKGIEDVFLPKNMSLIFCNTDEILEREDLYIDLLLRQRVDGVIAAATSQKWDVLHRAEALHTPLVVVDRAYEGLVSPYVGVDNYEGARMGVQHLIEDGYRSIAILAGFQRLSTMRERLSGFCNALDEHKIGLPDEWCISSPLSIEAGKEAALKLLSRPDRPRAIFINNNLLSLGTLLAVNELGLSCPSDIALIGFDDPPWAAVTCPPLTVIRQPSRHLGQVAAQMLFDLINGQPPLETHIKLECELVIRQSCCLLHK